MLFPRMESESSACGSRLRMVILTVFKCVFIFMSTPSDKTKSDSEGVSELHSRNEKSGRESAPVMVPWTTLPFLSSIVTVSLFSFIRKLTCRNVRACHIIIQKVAETYRTSFILGETGLYALPEVSSRRERRRRLERLG